MTFTLASVEEAINHIDNAQSVKHEAMVAVLAAARAWCANERAQQAVKGSGEPATCGFCGTPGAFRLPSPPLFQSHGSNS